MSTNAVNIPVLNQNAANQAVGAANSVLATARDASKVPIFIRSAVNFPQAQSALMHALTGDQGAQKFLCNLFVTTNERFGVEVQL